MKNKSLKHFVIIKILLIENLKKDCYEIFFRRCRIKQKLYLHKMHSRCLSIMGGHGNFAFNKVMFEFEVINNVNV
jgi:hypothetical protein